MSLSSALLVLTIFDAIAPFYEEHMEQLWPSSLCISHITHIVLCLSVRRLSPGVGKMLTFTLYLPGAFAVCRKCWGAGVGCKVGIDADAVCPWESQMAENTKAIAAAAGGAIVVASLLTPRLLRVFTKPVLDTLSMVVARPTGGQPFDLTGKTPHEIQKAVTARYVSKSEAIMELTGRLYSPELEISATDEAGRESWPSTGT